MRRHRLREFLGVLAVCLSVSLCTQSQGVRPGTPQPEVRFLSSGMALLSIPSLNGNHIAIRIMKPEGDGPFPVLIGVAGGDGMFAFGSALPTMLHERGIMTVDFAPQGRGESEGEDNYHGTVHQDDLKALVDFVSTQAFVQPDQIGILTYSYGVVLATGALSRYPEMPILFLIDWEGPSCPGRDVQRGLAHDEPWVHETIRFISGGRDIRPEDLQIHGGSIFDERYWQERDAAHFAETLPCPYLRVQFHPDHAQGTSKAHMMAIINAATAKSGQWTRCNDNPPNIIYSEEELSQYHFHRYSGNEIAGFSSAYSQSVDTILLGYVEEMFFSRPYEGQ
jgi:hypothetical protein